ncbi:hypothetical protein OG562_43250 [Streptomyces sp. NBC_01275]|uniref:hypothetical protein n=1 Tax=Streptomyces sp. NBC_01275 TaxID=2903807 RepID=UPI0022575C37|nr:hypothetical protein [Streptomyces sp. NBC_01275]MCX4767658.1 hypothetical protein [Streptomyces sp. NBC_01275]
MTELRLGPFSDTGRGQKTVQPQVQATRDIAVADYDHDRLPDLATYAYIGDGVYATLAHLGDRAAGLVPDTGRRYAVEEPGTGHYSPVELPNAGLTPFYPPCAGDDEGG